LLGISVVQNWKFFSLKPKIRESETETEIFQKPKSDTFV